MSDATWSPAIPTRPEGKPLDETFPSYLREALLKWMWRVIGDSNHYVSTDVLVSFQNSAQTDLGFRNNGSIPWSAAAQRLREITHTDFTNLCDFLAAHSYFPTGKPHPIEGILSEGGSAWTVIRWNSSYAKLVKQVPDGVLSAMQPALTAKDAASVKLQEAWIDAYGVNPRASVAYSHAVVAVETAALSVIPTTKAEPTLADTFSILEAENPKWRLVFRDNAKAPGAKSLAAMLRVLWRGHESRHGRPDYADASLDEARAAIILAATLVQWFTSGVVVPATASE